MKIAVFTVSMPEYAPERALEVAADLGYNGLEWRITADTGDTSNPGFWSGNRTSMTPEQLIEKAPELRKIADSLGMEMPSLGSYVNCLNPEGVEAVFKAANAIGAKAARINTTTYLPEVPFAEQMKTCREGYARVEKLAKRYGVRALIETHMGLLTPSVPLCLMVLEGLDPAYTGIMWDPGNQVYEGLERYDMALNAAGEYLGEVHVKNRADKVTGTENGTQLWSTVDVPLSTGAVNWPEVIAELKKVHYKGWLAMEDFSTEQPLLERLQNNISYLRGPCGVADEREF